MQACNLQSMAVSRVYNTLLASRGVDENEQVHLPIVRLRLLRSQLTVLGPFISVHLEQNLGSAFGALHSGARREVSVTSSLLFFGDLQIQDAA